MYSAQEKEAEKKAVTQCHAFIGIGYGGGLESPPQLLGIIQFLGTIGYFWQNLTCP